MRMMMTTFTTVTIKEADIEGFDHVTQLAAVAGIRKHNDIQRDWRLVFLGLEGPLIQCMQLSRTTEV
jgi:hypothetical protein